MLRPRRFGGQISYADHCSAAAEAGLVLGVVDDPELAMRLLSVRGRLASASLDVLAAAFGELGTGSRLHLDLTDVEFTDRSVLTGLAGLLDELDDRRVRLRIVGLGRLASVDVD
jgi:hypothetical protein